MTKVRQSRKHKKKGGRVIRMGEELASGSPPLGSRIDFQ
jgi:hypothetical protein